MRRGVALRSFAWDHYSTVLINVCIREQSVVVAKRGAIRVGPRVM